MNSNPIMLTDSYKLSHFNQYPSDMYWMQSYLESRGGDYKDIVFYGLTPLLQGYMHLAPTHLDVAEAQFYASKHGVPFNEKDFIEICKLGYWPVKITAKKEGSVCSPNDVLMTIESTDKRFPWAVNYLETLLMKVWYPSTVASKAYYVRQLLKKWYEYAGADQAGIDFAYHNFGDRGSSSVEAAALGGAAHLTSFKGTDNFHCLKLIDNTYTDSDTNIGFSIPATEHSTVTTWGKEGENAMIEHYLESNRGKPIIACVMDSYNIYKAVEYVTTHLKTRIESPDYPIFVIRPDSGNPLEVIPSILSIMETNKVAYTTHLGTKGEYKLFNKYRIIWGDGVDPDAIDSILELVVQLGYSPANFAFGSGGDLMQKVNRDTCKFAIKCCAAKFGESHAYRPICKEPLHDGFKKSKAGIQEVKGGVIYYNNGYIYDGYTFDEIRAEVRAGSR